MRAQNQLLANDTRRIRYAVQYLQVASGVKRSKKVGGMTESRGEGIHTQHEMKDYLEQLSQMERTAPAIEIEEPQENPSNKVKVTKPMPSRGNRFWMYNSLAVSVALIGLLLYAGASV